MNQNPTKNHANIMIKTISSILIILGLLVMAASCMGGYMTVQGKLSYGQSLSALISFLAVVVGIILFVLSGDNEK